MKRIKRVVDTGFWSDEKVLNFTPEDKYFWLFLLTNEYTTQLGIYYLPIKKAAFDLGYSEDAVKVLIDRFEHKYELISYSRDSGEVAIKNYLLYSIVSGGKPVYDCLVKEQAQVKDKSLLNYVYGNLTSKDINNNTLKQYLDNLEIYINDNDNERIVHESSTNRKNNGKSRKTDIPKSAYGSQQNVFLTEDEYSRLRKDFPEADEAIEFLSLYIGEKNYKSQSHNLAIRRWVINAVRERKDKPKYGEKKKAYGSMMQNDINFDELEKKLLT